MNSYIFFHVYSLQIREFTSFNAIKKRDPLFAAFQRVGDDNAITAKKSENFFRRGELCYAFKLLKEDFRRDISRHIISYINGIVPGGVTCH